MKGGHVMFCPLAHHIPSIQTNNPQGFLIKFWTAARLFHAPYQGTYLCRLPSRKKQANFKATGMNQMLWRTILGITRGEDLSLNNQKLSNYHVMHELAAHETTVSDVQRAFSNPTVQVHSVNVLVFPLMASTGDGKLGEWDLGSHLYLFLCTTSASIRFCHICKSLSLQQSRLWAEEIITSLQT